MAALVCDICGGKLVMGAGGIAVCDSCGMEHSPDRMKEKIQEVKGTVRVDNSHMIDNWMKMGNAAAQAGNNKEAYEYFTKVIEVDPENWRAIYEKGKAGAWQSTLGNSRTAELYQAVRMALEIINSSSMPVDEFASVKNEFAVAIYNINNAFLDLRTNNFDKHEDKFYDLHWDEWWETYYVQGTENIRQTEDVITMIADLDDDLSKENVIEMKKHICEVLRKICSAQETYWDSYEKNYLKCFGITELIKTPFIEKYIRLVTEIRETEPDYATSQYSQIDPWDPPYRWSSDRYDKLLKYWQGQEETLKATREKEMAKKRHEEYWKEHSEDKKRYEERIREIDKEIDRIKKQSSRYDVRIAEIRKDALQKMPSEARLAEIKRKQSELNTQKSNLGLFSGKQKKQLQEQIDELQVQINEVDKTIARERASIQEDVNSRIDAVELERKPLLAQIAAFEKEEQNINNELIKGR